MGGGKKEKKHRPAKLVVFSLSRLFNKQIHIMIDVREEQVYRDNTCRCNHIHVSPATISSRFLGDRSTTFIIPWRIHYVEKSHFPELTTIRLQKVTHCATTNRLINKGTRNCGGIYTTKRGGGYKSPQRKKMKKICSRICYGHFWYILMNSSSK